MRSRLPARLAALGLALAAAGCNESTISGGTQLVEVASYRADNGAPTGGLRVSYPDRNTAVLVPFGADGVATDTFRQTCRFEADAGALPAVTERYMVNRLAMSPTGSILLAILGMPSWLDSCQSYFPGRAVWAEQLRYPKGDPGGQMAEDVMILRGPDGLLQQRHSGAGVATLVSTTGFDAYTEELHYRRDGGRVSGYVYGAPAWPAGDYTDYSGIVMDIFLSGALSGLMGTPDGLFVSPSAGHAVRYGYDGQGRLESEARYSGWGGDGEWLTGDDVPAVAGLTRYQYDGQGRLARTESGLDVATGEATADYRLRLPVYAGDSLREVGVYDGGGHVLQRWIYKSNPY